MQDLKQVKKQLKNFKLTLIDNFKMMKITFKNVCNILNKEK